MAQSTRPYETANQPLDIKKNLWWIIGGVVVILILGLVGFWLYNNSQAQTVRYEYKGLVTDTDPTFGKTDSNVTLVFFEDFACHVCADNHPEFNKVIDTYSDRVRFTFKPVDILNAGSATVARAAYAAGVQGKYKEFTGLAYEKQTDMRSKRESTTLDIAKQLNLDMERFNEDRNFNETFRLKTTWNNDDVKRTVFRGGIERSANTAEQPVSGTRIKEEGIGITATPSAAIMKGNEVVSWWDGYADSSTIGKRLDVVLAN